MSRILLSDLAVEQLEAMPPRAGRLMLEAFHRLRTFPQSAPRLSEDGYEVYRQVLIRPFRAVYRYLEDDDEVRIYCILHMRRRLPTPDFLTHQIF